MQKQLTVVAHLHLREDNFKEARQFLLNLVSESRADPACVDYHLHQDVENPLEFTFYENWVDRASWERHMQVPSLLELARRRPDFFTSPTEIRLLTMISDRA